MRTTVSIDDEVLRQARERAIAEGRSLSDLVTESLRARLAVRPARGRRRISLPTDGAGGVRPGVDLTNNVALRELIDGPG